MHQRKVDSETSISGPNRPDILFFFCPYTGHPPPHRFDINLGAAYLAAYLKEHGLRACFYHGGYDNDPGFGRVLEYADGLHPRAFGFTVYGSNLPETAALSRALKTRHPEIPVIWGGPEVRFEPVRIMEHYADCMDFCISGEGERPLYALLTTDQWQAAPGAEPIAGLSFKDPRTGRIQALPPGPRLVEERREDRPAGSRLDIYPSPYLEGVVPEDYFRDKTVVSILTSRGCPYACTYCQFSSLGDHRVHFHSVKRVISEIRWIHEHVLRYHPHKREIMIMIYDEALTLSRKRIEDLCARLIKEPLLPPVRFWVDTRADHADEGLLRLLARAGVKKINFGLESAVPRVLRTIRKVRLAGRDSGQDLAPEKRFLGQVRRAVGWSRTQGLLTSVSIIVGLPTESLKDVRRTLDFVKDLEVDFYYHNFLNVLEGTELARRAPSLGYDTGTFPPGYMGKYGHRYTSAPIPTRSVQPLKNAMVFERDRRRFGVLLRGWAYQRVFGLRRWAGMRFHPFVLGWNGDSRRFSACLLRHGTGLSASVFIDAAGPDPSPDLAAELRRLPLGNGRLHTLPAPGQPAGRIRGIEEADHSTPYLVVCREWGRVSFPDDGRAIFVRIDGAEDFESLVEILKRRGFSGTQAFSLERAEALPFDLLECCRWFRGGGPACPAPLLTHLYVDPSGGLRPCLHFPPVASAGEGFSMNVLRRRAAARVAESARRRGCARCPVREVCPRCVCPHPLSERAYCDWQIHWGASECLPMGQVDFS